MLKAIQAVLRWLEGHWILVGYLGAAAVATYFFYVWFTQENDTAAVYGFVASTALALITSTIHGRDLRAMFKSLRDIDKRTQQVLFNEVTLAIFTRIQSNELLARRMQDDSAPTKNAIGQVLSRRFVEGRSVLEQLCIDGSTFIESGSTYAYLSLAIAQHFQRADDPDDRAETEQPSTRPHFTTNNILASLVLQFESSCDVTMYPGTPVGKYGATYGTNDLPELRSFFEGREPDRILLAVSKLDVTYGCHTGSLRNAQYKRNLVNYASEKGIPLVIIVDGSKVESLRKPPIKSCHPIFAEFEETQGKKPKWPSDSFGRFRSMINSGEVVLLVGNRGGNVCSDGNALREKLLQSADDGLMASTIQHGEYVIEAYYQSDPTLDKAKPIASLLKRAR